MIGLRADSRDPVVLQRTGQCALKGGVAVRLAGFGLGHPASQYRGCRRAMDVRTVRDVAVDVTGAVVAGKDDWHRTQRAVANAAGEIGTVGEVLPLVDGEAHVGLCAVCNDSKVALPVCGRSAWLLLPTRTRIGRSLGHGLQLRKFIMLAKDDPGMLDLLLGVLFRYEP